MIQKFIIRIVIATLAITFCQAQEEQRISLQFLSFPALSTPQPIELLIGENETIPIEIPSNELSPDYKVARSESAVIGITTKNEKGKPTFKVLGKAPLLASTKQIIILLRKGENDSDGFEVIPIDGALTNFSGGSFLFVNISKINIGGVIGDKNFALKPGQRNLIKPKATHEGGGCQVTLAFQKNESENKVKKFYDTRWSVNDTFRTLVFFYHEPETKSLCIAPIINFLEPKNTTP
jgi:hypothetical protein